jgi:Tol biopolymer transport system component
MSWSPDGKVLAYTVQKGSDHDIWTFSPDNPREEPLLNGPTDEYTPRFSPDGGWLAYVSRDLRTATAPDVWVMKYPKGDPIPVSRAGGEGPVWSRDGRALYFQSVGSDPKLMKVPVTRNGDSIELGKPQPLFNLSVPRPDGTARYLASSNMGPNYDVLPDGRFVMIRWVEQDAREIVLVQHWFEEVKRLFQTR